MVLTLPSPRGVRIASSAGMIIFAHNVELPSPRGVRIASWFLLMITIALSCSCRPREGCGLHPISYYQYSGMFQLPSPRGVRIASAKGYKSV